jgi:hypothetical protein
MFKSVHFINGGRYHRLAQYLICILLPDLCPIFSFRSEKPEKNITREK